MFTRETVWLDTQKRRLIGGASNVATTTRKRQVSPTRRALRPRDHQEVSSYSLSRNCQCVAIVCAARAVTRAARSQSSTAEDDALQLSVPPCFPCVAGFASSPRLGPPDGRFVYRR